MKKKELFYKVIAYMEDKYKAKPTRKCFEDYVLYSFKITDGRLSRAKEIIKANKESPKDLKLGGNRLYAKIVDDANIRFDINIIPQIRIDCYDSYITIKYNKVKDSISVACFNTGYRLASNKDIIYPFKEHINVLCYSKHLYYLYSDKRKTKVNCVRILTGRSPLFGDLIEITNILLQRHPEADFGFLKESYKYFIGTKDAVQVIENRLGIKIPKALRGFIPEDLNVLFSVLEDTNQANKICQMISKHKTEINNPANITQDNTLYTYIGLALGISQYWLVRDWMKELYVLGKKTNLSITSEKRIREEHTRNSRIVTLMGVKAIKTADIYKQIMNEFPIPEAELIDHKDRLLQEGIEQDHCVVTYADSINKGNCAIISMMYNDKRYTMEVKYTNKSKFIVSQIQSKQNQGRPKELADIMTSYLDNINNLSVDLHSISNELEPVMEDLPW